MCEAAQLKSFRITTNTPVPNGQVIFLKYAYSMMKKTCTHKYVLPIGRVVGRRAASPAVTGYESWWLRAHEGTGQQIAWASDWYMLQARISHPPAHSTEKCQNYHKKGLKTGGSTVPVASIITYVQYWQVCVCCSMFRQCSEEISVFN